jgi:1-phosphofructokinase family hexose kinase
MGVKIVDRARGETTDLNFPGLAPDAAALAELVARVDEAEAAWCVLAGSLPSGVPADFYANCIRRLKARGVRVALDASGDALRLGLAAGPDVAKPNVHELEEIVGVKLSNTDSILAAARTIVEAGTSLVVVSRGEEGALFVTADTIVRARGPVIRDGSTVGAGDAMVAGVVASQIEGLSLLECARRATAYSLRALAGSGTITAWAEKVEISG